MRRYEAIIMAKDLRQFLGQLQQSSRDDMRRIPTRVSLDREPAAMLREAQRHAPAPALRFEHAGDSAFPLMFNVLGELVRQLSHSPPQPGLPCTFNTLDMKRMMTDDVFHETWRRQQVESYPSRDPADYRLASSAVR